VKRAAAWKDTQNGFGSCNSSGRRKRLRVCRLVLWFDSAGKDQRAQKPEAGIKPGPPKF
jgi:hypothetical protein